MTGNTAGHVTGKQNYADVVAEHIQQDFALISGLLLNKSQLLARHPLTAAQANRLLGSVSDQIDLLTGIRTQLLSDMRAQLLTGTDYRS
jgi:hypothetical protein